MADRTSLKNLVNSVYFALTVITPCMIAKWPGKVQMKG